MRIRVCLSPKTDPDLIALYNSPDFDFKWWCIKSLDAYAKGKAFRMPLPEIMGDVSPEPVKISITVRDTTVEWLSMVRDGMKYSAIKAVLRCSLETPYMEAFLIKTVPTNSLSPSKGTQSKPVKSHRSERKPQIAKPIKEIDVQKDSPSPVLSPGNGDFDIFNFAVE